MLLASANHRIHYDIIGPMPGEVVCFAHALLADSGMWAEQTAALLGAGFRVLRIDMRGHGGSDAGGERCSVLDLAQDVIAVLDHLSLERVHFVGLSIGGIIGQAIAIHFPKRLLSLVLSDTNAASSPNAKTMWAERIAIVREAKSVAPLGAGMMARLLSKEFAKKNPVRWKQILTTIECTRPEGMYACAEALQNFNFERELASVLAPVLVLCGENDPATPPAEARKIAGLIANAKYEEIPGALHFPNIEQSELYSAVLLRWLSSLAQ
jgi:3-oxoadipate enol-lactonase